MAPLLWESVTLPIRNFAASEVIGQVSSILILLAAGILVYRAFRSNYLLAWLLGWVAYLGCRMAGSFALAHPGRRGLEALTHACFGLAVACFAIAVLLYAQRSARWITGVGLMAAIGMIFGGVYAVWWPNSLLLAVALYLVYIIVPVVAAVHLALFSRGRHALGPWLLTAMLLLIPANAPGGLLWMSAMLIEVLLGLGMLLLVLDDAATRSRRLRVANTITTALAQARDYEPMLSMGVEQLRVLMNSEAAWFRLLEGDRLLLSTHSGAPTEYLRDFAVIGLDDTPAGRIIRDGKPELVRLRHRKERAAQFLAGAGFEHLLVVPVQGTSAVIGVLALAGKRYRSYTTDEFAFLADTARQLGIAVENLRLLDQILYSQRQWVNTFDSIEDGLMVHDERGQIIRVNRALCSRLGKRPDEVTGRPVSDVLPNSEGGCPYCARITGRAGRRFEEGPDPCFAGYSVVSTYSYGEDGSRQLGTIHIVRDTTRLRLIEQTYKVLFDGVHEGAFISTPEGRLVDCNEAFVRMVGYSSREELLAEDLRNIYANPGDRDLFRRDMEKQGFVREYEVVLRRKDGSLLTAIESSFATRTAEGSIDRYQGFLLDITSRKKAEEQGQQHNRELQALYSIAVIATESLEVDEILNRTLQQLATVFAADTGAAWLVDRERGVLVRRAAFGHRAKTPEVTEVPNSEELWERIREGRIEVLTQEYLPLLPQVARDFVRQEDVQNFMWAPMWSKEQVIGLLGVSLRSDRQFSSQEQQLMVAISRQLAQAIEKLRLYEETTQAYDHLRRTQEQLLQSEKMSAVGQLISGVAHELNNPLTAILGYSELLEGEPLDDRTRDFVRKIFRQAQRTHHVVQSLLSFARQRKPRKEQIDVRRIVEETLVLRDYDLKLNNVTLERQYEENLPGVVADAHQLEQVFLNIINNAADAMLEKARGGLLRVRVYRDGANVMVSFQDSGPGVTDTKRIFDPFYTTKAVGKGTGLGLSICYGIIKEHGGEILACNHPQGGALFLVSLPMAQPALQPAAQPIAAGARRSILQGRVLLVDDEEPVLDFEREVLTGAGADVTALRGGEEAVALLQKENFDAVILDGKMPGGWTGFDIYHWLQEHRPALVERVILTMSNLQDEEFRDLVETKKVAYLAKPFEVTELIAAVRRAVTRASAATSAP